MRKVVCIFILTMLLFSTFCTSINASQGNVTSETFTVDGVEYTINMLTTLNKTKVVVDEINSKTTVIYDSKKGTIDITTFNKNNKTIQHESYKMNDFTQHEEQKPEDLTIQQTVISSNADLWWKYKYTVWNYTT